MSAEARSQSVDKTDRPDTISTQTEFDSLLKRVADRQEVNAYLKGGIYTIQNYQPVYTKFKLRGEGAKIKQKNKILSKKDAIRETTTHYVCPAGNIPAFSLFVDSTGKIIQVSEEVEPESKINFSPSDIIAVKTQDATNLSQIKIKIPKNLEYLKNKTFDGAFGYIDSWWTSPSFMLTHSDAEYFYCDLLMPRKEEQFNSLVNGEMHAYKQLPSFVIYNVVPQAGRVFYDSQYVYIPKEYEEVEIIDSSRSQLFSLQENAELDFENISMINTNSIAHTYKNFNGSIKFENCKFKNILKQVLDTYEGNDLQAFSVNGCEFVDCAFIEYVPLIRIKSPNCIGKISDSYFNQYADGFCVYKNVMQYIYIGRCKKFDITDNLFVNNPRGAIFMMYGKFNVTSNEFFNDSVFNSYNYRNFSRDAGAIYCNRLYEDYIKTKDNPNKISLKLNKIHDFYGKGDVNGIFIDDGRGDVTCYGNLIFNGQAYSIDSRVVTSDPYSSIRNNFEYNIVAYPYRLTYGEKIPKSDRPKLNHNILLFTGIENKTTQPSKNDINVSKFEIDGSNVKLDRKILKKLPKDIRKILVPLD